MKEEEKNKRHHHQWTRKQATDKLACFFSDLKLGHYALEANTSMNELRFTSHCV